MNFKKTAKIAQILFLATAITPYSFANDTVSFGSTIPSSKIKVGSNVKESSDNNVYSNFSSDDDAPIIRPGMPDIRPEKGTGPEGMDFFGNERETETKKRSLGSAKQYVMTDPMTQKTKPSPQIESVNQIQDQVNKTAAKAYQIAQKNNPFSNSNVSNTNSLKQTNSKNVNSNDGSETTTKTQTSYDNGEENDNIILHKDTEEKQKRPMTLAEQASDPKLSLEQTKENQRLLRALRREFPSNEQINIIRNEGYRTRGAEIAPYTNQTPIKRTISVSMNPGSDIPAIHLSYGIATPITFNDISGQPWDISYAVWDRQQFDINGYEQTISSGKTTDKDGKTVENIQKVSTNTLVIVPLKAGDISGRNLVIQLKGAKTPVNFMLDQGKGSTYDAQVYASIQERGPNAKEDYVQDMIAPSNDSEMQNFIDGVPPKGAHKRKTDNPSVEAWTYNHLLYIRTSGEVFAPGPQKRATSSLYGVGVFAVADSPAITVSFDGELSVVRIN